MTGNSFGTLIRLTTFGESHGPAIGGVLDGFPAGMQVDVNAVQLSMDRRRPGQSSLTTARSETDRVEFLSGIYQGITTGAPIGFIIRNADQRSADYDELKDVYRPSHADYTYEARYGIRDHRGGGRSSARETACRVVAGALALQLLAHHGVTVKAWVSAVGNETMSDTFTVDATTPVDVNEVRCPDMLAAERMRELIARTRDEGDSVGGVISFKVFHPLAGLGDPVFGKLEADLAAAMLSINAVKGFEIGSGFSGSRMKGSAHNDLFVAGSMETSTNYSGGIQGGISNGMPIYGRVAFKPVATIAQKQSTVSRDGQGVSIEAKGRHDPCVVPRAVPIVEAMCSLVLADHFMRLRSARL